MRLIVKPHKIIIDKDKLVNEKEIDISKCTFEFDEEITDDFVKEALFTFKGTTYSQLINNNECAFPQEVLAEKGQVEIGVVAYKVENEVEIKRYNPSPAYFNTLLGSLKDDVENSEEITPTDKEQILNELANKQDTLVSGANIKTINHETLLGEGNINITGSGGTSDYEDLDNKPSINNVELSGNKSLNDLGIQPSGNYALESDIPTKISDLTDDSNFLESTDLKTINGNSLVGSGDITTQTLSSGDGVTLENGKINVDLPNYVIIDNTSQNPFVIQGCKPGKYTFPSSSIYLKGFINQNDSNSIALMGGYIVITNSDISEESEETIQQVGYAIGGFSMNYPPNGYMFGVSPITVVTASGRVNAGNVQGNWVVSSTNNQNVGGVKTFTTLPESSITPTTNNQFVNKKYVDDAIASAITTTLGGSY